MTPLRPHMALGSLVLVVAVWIPGAVQAEQGRLERIEVGERHFAEHRYGAALRAFVAAHAASSEPSLLYNIAMCQWELGRVPQAVNSFRDYLEAEREHLTPRDRQDVEEILESLRDHHGDVLLVATDPGVELLVDGRVVGLAPLERPVAVSPGHHRFAARHEGLWSAVVTSAVGPRGRVTINLGPARSQRPEETPSENEAREWRRSRTELTSLLGGSSSLGPAVALDLGLNVCVAADESGCPETGFGFALATDFAWHFLPYLAAEAGFRFGTWRVAANEEASSSSWHNIAILVGGRGTLPLGPLHISVGLAIGWGRYKHEQVRRDLDYDLYTAEGFMFGLSNSIDLRFTAHVRMGFRWQLLFPLFNKQCFRLWDDSENCTGLPDDDELDYDFMIGVTTTVYLAPRTFAR